jgi:CubicO group peptidase (beta-lactamase class C family)
MNKIIRISLSLFLVFSFFIGSTPQIVCGQTAARQTQISRDLQSRLAKIEEKVEARRKELGIPGMSLAIVKDGEVVLMNGFGYKSFEKQIPVTADTQFAIGSATKAFTAFSVLMSQDEGKLSLDEHPRKYLPYFKINDPEINEKITVRNLLTHSSGLGRTDLAMITGKLTREELIKVAGEAKPVAKLGEKFGYQNIMYAAAGETVAKVQNMTWENFVAQKILKPLGMMNSSISVAEMQKAKDYSFGYDYNFDTKQTRLLPTREIAQVSPAGSINSSARDMANWLKFILNKGEFEGKRLVSEKSFEEWLKPHQKITPDGKVSYALGWFVQDWKGKKVVQHGGNIDGFNSMVAMLPEENLGFVMLTNVTGSSLGGELMPIIWSGILESTETPKPAGNTVAVAPEKEVGKYKFVPAGFDIEVKMEEGKLKAYAPNQPTYVLENVGGRKYKLTGAPEGFFITFKDTEAFLEQPQGNYTLPKAGAGSSGAANTEAVKELIGKYSTPNGAGIIEVKEVDGKTSLVVPNQPPYPLVEKAKDEFRSPALPDSYGVKIKRDGAGKIETLVLVQPEGEFSFKYLGAADKAETPKIAVDELMTKTIAALGGEENWRRLNSRVTKIEADMIHQGVKATGTTYEKAPNMAANEMIVTAGGKQIATIEDYFDGANGFQKTSFSPPDTMTGERLEDSKISSDFYGLANWKKNFKEAKIEGTEKVGGEEAYKVVFKPEKGNAVTYFISTKTFLPLKRNSVVASSTSQQKIPQSLTFEDYREVDGVKLPFKSISSNPGMGDIVIYVKEVKHNVKIDDKRFMP